jgi:hypothetical protein
MSIATQELLKAGLQLTAEERRLLAEELLASLAEEDDEAFLAEIQRRRDEAIRDPSCMIPAHEINWNS